MLDQGIPSPEHLDRNNDTEPESPSMTSGSSLLFVAQLATNLGYFVAVLLLVWIWLAIVVWALPAMCASGYDCSTLIERKQ